MADKTVPNLSSMGLDLKLKDLGDGSFGLCVVMPAGSTNIGKVTLDGALPAGANQIGDVAVKSDSNISVVATYKRTLVADTDVSLDIPIGVKLAFIFSALATPVFARLDAEVTIPVAGAASQSCFMYPPNMGIVYAMFDSPTTVDTHDLHVRSASAGDVWVCFCTE